ncbi:MAG TPA: hypothetical protein VFG09_07090 [Thermodesulfovibrionales bacterium]|nr:hypothetical protein [Thermodesulfovibrionales bacterium]
MRLLVSILIFFSLGSSIASATSIVVVRENNAIVIGADSKTTLMPGSGAGGAGSITKCKIVQAGNLFFASAGSAGIGPAEFPGDVYPEFDLKEIIAEGLKGDGRIEDKMRVLETVLVASLTRIVEKARQDDAAFFLTRFAGHPAHTIIVGGLADGELVLMVRTFRLIISPSGSLSFEIGRFACPGDCQGPVTAIFEGQTGAIRKYLEQHKLFLSYADPVTAVRGLVGIEISEDPSFVGPPIDILRLTKRDAQWIQRKPLCLESKENLVFPTGERDQGFSVGVHPAMSRGH